MKTIEIENLQNKEIKSSREIMAVSFEYMLAEIVNIYFENLDYTSVSDFNLRNRLSLDKLLVYPFFVAASNKNTESLFKLFGEFRALSFGPAAVNLYSPVRSGNLKHFQIESKENPLGATINKAENIKDLKNKIKKTKILFEDNITEDFEEIKIYSDKQENLNREKNFLHEAITASVNTINYQSGGNFFYTNTRGILYQASYFRSFRELYKSNTTDILDFNNLENPSNRPFYEKISTVTDVKKVEGYKPTRRQNTLRMAKA